MSDPKTELEYSPDSLGLGPFIAATATGIIALGIAAAAVVMQLTGALS